MAGVGVWTAGLKESSTWLYSLLWWCWVCSHELPFPLCQGWCKTLPQVLGCHSWAVVFLYKDSNSWIGPASRILLLVGHEQPEPAYRELITGPGQQ